MSDVSGSVIYLLARVETLQQSIAQSYRDVGEATREIQLLNNLLMQLRPVPRASTPHQEEQRVFPVHPAVRPLQPRHVGSAENIKSRYPRFPFSRTPDTNIPE